MQPVRSLVVLLGLALCMLPVRQTMAQQSSSSDVVYEAARNKIGLFRYCRKNALLDPATADQVVAAVESGLRALPANDGYVRERGDLAEEAGEDGFWDAGRSRDIAGIATLFRTTPTELCEEWADETLRTQAQKRFREVKTITVRAPSPPNPQAELEPEPPRDDLPPVAETAALEDRSPVADMEVAAADASLPPPPLPEKAPFLPTKAEFATMRDTIPTVGHLAATGSAGAGQMSDAPAMPLPPIDIPGPLDEAAAPSERRAGRKKVEAEPPPPAHTGTVAAHSRRLYGRTPPDRDNRLFNRVGKTERCLLPGCRWPTPQERRGW